MNLNPDSVLDSQFEPDGPRLLVVDDNAEFRELAARRFARAGYQVSLARTAAEAQLRLSDGGWDLLLVGAMPSPCNGFELLRQVREHYPLLELPVIMITAAQDNNLTIKALKLGANDCVGKPVDFSVVCARVNTQLDLKRQERRARDYLSVASHDLKKPLAVIVDAVECLQEGLDLSSAKDRDIQEITQLVHKSAKSMQQVVWDYLDLRVIESGGIRLNRVSTDLERLLKTLILRNQYYAGKKNIRLMLDVGKAVSSALIDPGRTDQILENLIGNAIKFSQAGTTVTLRLREDGNHAAVEISDEGPGFKPEALAKVFRKFANLGNQPTGGENSTGLGLAICKELAALQGGHIRVRNNNGPGATFTLRLPLRPAPA